MQRSAQVLQRAEIEKSGLATRIQSLHQILQSRYPFVSRVALALYDPGSDMLSTFASSTDAGQPLSHYEMPLSSVPSLASLRDQHARRVVDDIEQAFTAPSTHSDWLRAQHYRSSYTLPVFKGEELRAFLFFDAREPRCFVPEVTQVLDQFADIVTQLYFMRLAAVDGLIGAVGLATGLARTRDVETGFHLERMAKYSRLIAQGIAPQWGLSDEYVEYVHLFAPLHDIGKVGIPDRILLKPGRLDGEEWAQMQTHVEIGLRLVEHIVADLGLQQDPAAQVMRELVGGHHERGDGSGYPRGLRLADIPLPARIVAVADVYDALSSARPYKPAWPEARCLAVLQEEVDAGRLDPDCVAALVAGAAAREQIRARYADPD